LRAFCLSAPWQIELLLRVQECRFITPSQGAGLIVQMGCSHICPLGSQTQQWKKFSTEKKMRNAKDVDSLGNKKPQSRMGSWHFMTFP
jgi:hypothetical protein